MFKGFSLKAAGIMSPLQQCVPLLKPALKRCSTHLRGTVKMAICETEWRFKKKKKAEKLDNSTLIWVCNITVPWKFEPLIKLHFSSTG